MIKPTLFVGLGTTGTEILKVLRDLMSEEYNTSGLPIFRYVAIETREAETGDNPRHSEDYEQITVVNATIDETAPIQNKLNSDHPQYNRHLEDWLNPALLNKIQSFKDGASNIRMAGRLCLWENWEEIRTKLSSARNDVIDPVNVDATLELLTQHYQAKHLDVPHPLVNNNGINTYVVGSLCGGSCSGMMIDMAYFLRTLIGRNTNNRFYGIFTMYDQLLAAGTADDISTRAANCYAGLSEINYYSYTETNYSITFPNKQQVNTRQVPFDYAMFVSPTGELPAIRFVAGGAVDIDGLNLMVALNLFAEAAGDADGQKRQIRSDWLAFGDYGGLKPMPVGDTRTMVKCLASFGLTAVWYPKYRIASAAACLTSQKLCENWSNRHIDGDTIKADTSDEWREIRNNARILTDPEVEDQPSLTVHIERLLSNANRRFNRYTSSKKLSDEMQTFPNENGVSLGAMFTTGGRYFNWIASKVGKCKEAFRAVIDDTLRNQLIRIRFDNTYGLDDVQAFFIELDKILEQIQQRCPSDLPTLNLSALDFEPMRSANNIWTKAAGKQKQAVEAHRERLIEEYRQLVIGKEGIYRKLRDHFLRQVLEDVRAKLGFTVHSEDITIKQQLDRIKANLDRCAQELRKDYDFYSEQPRYECVKIVTNDPQNSIREDANVLHGQIANANIEGELLGENGNQVTMDVFLKKAPEDITPQIKKTYRHLALNKINEVGEDGIANGLVVTKAQQILEVAGDDLRNLARRSNPYQEFTSEYESFHLETGTKIIFGHDPTEGHHRLNALKNSLDFERSGNSSVDHLLFFYEEEASFTLDDLAAYELLRGHFENTGVVYGHWTHKDPDFYDLTLPEKRAKLERWCKALAELVPEIRKNTPNAFKDVFQNSNGLIIFIYRDQGGLVDKRLYLSDDELGIQELCRQDNENAYNNFFGAVTTEFLKFDPEKVSQSVSELTKLAKTVVEQHKLTNSYSEFLQEVYPDGVVIPAASSGPDPSTSGAAPQPTQETPDKEPETGLSPEKLIQQFSQKESLTEDEKQKLMQLLQQNLGTSSEQTSTDDTDYSSQADPEKNME